MSREYRSFPSTTVETPLGAVTVTATNAHHVHVSASWGTDTAPITVNNVEYKLTAHLYCEHGWNGQDYQSISIDRAEWRGKVYDYSAAALKKVRKLIPEAIAAWAQTPEGRALLAEAEVSAASNALYSTERDLGEVEEKRRALVAQQVEQNDRLRAAELAQRKVQDEAWHGVHS